MKCLSYLVLLVLISCGSGEVRQTVGSDSYQTSGIEQFFLPQLPEWANFSDSGQCMKQHNFHYLDFPKIAKAYQLKYPEMMELQAQYNERIESYLRSTAIRFIKPVEEAAFFSNTLEQVRGGIKSFKLPAGVGAVELIWLDGFISENKIEELKTLAKSGRFDEKLPLLFSACLSRQGLAQWLLENDLDQVGFYTLSAEWLNPSASDLTIKPGLRLELKQLLETQTKVYLHGPNQKLPIEIIL